MDSKSSTFVKSLASNKRQTRENAIESLKQFLAKSKPLPQLEYQKLWKGLFYAMWFSDRPRPQQRLAKNLGLLFSETIPRESFIAFTEAFWSVICREWSGIDQWRVDKFYMLIRRVVYYCFERVLKVEDDDEVIGEYLELLSKIPLSGDRKIPAAIPYHLIDIYVDELERSMFEDLEEAGDAEKEEGEAAEDAEAMKDEIIEATPVQQLLEPFAKLRKEALLKTLREKIAEDVYNDDRLVAWGVVERETKKQPKAAKGAEEDEVEDQDEEEEEEEEWTGF